mmetsp:Transcript_12056/g.23248  ORF Transcript_12056/g.23248 Transcript_12056/m.23248 type:complete len:154 (+) Transcript_12056:204-665(+)
MRINTGFNPHINPSFKHQKEVASFNDCMPEGRLHVRVLNRIGRSSRLTRGEKESTGFACTKRKIYRGGKEEKHPQETIKQKKKPAIHATADMMSTRRFRTGMNLRLPPKRIKTSKYSNTCKRDQHFSKNGTAQRRRRGRNKSEKRGGEMKVSN